MIGFGGPVALVGDLGFRSRSTLRLTTGHNPRCLRIFGYAENEMTMGKCLEHFSTEPLTEFHNTLLMAGRAAFVPSSGRGEIAALA